MFGSSPGVVEEGLKFVVLTRLVTSVEELVRWIRVRAAESF